MFVPIDKNSNKGISQPKSCVKSKLRERSPRVLFLILNLKDENVVESKFSDR